MGDRPFLFLGLLNAILGTAAAALFNSLAVKGATHDVITNTGKVLYTTTTYQDDTVFLQIVSFVGNVGDDFNTGGEAHLRNFTDRGVQLLGRTGHDLHTDAAAEGIVFKRTRLGLGFLHSARIADKLVNGRH